MVGRKRRIVLPAKQDIAVRKQQQTSGIGKGDVIGWITGAIEGIAVILEKPTRRALRVCDLHARTEEYISVDHNGAWSIVNTNLEGLAVHDLVRQVGAVRPLRVGTCRVDCGVFVRAKGKRGAIIAL